MDKFGARQGSIESMPKLLAKRQHDTINGQTSNRRLN
jgi:hypothetical protein